MPIMSHNIKTKQKVYGMSGDSLEGKEWCGPEMSNEKKEKSYNKKERKQYEEGVSAKA